MCSRYAIGKATSRCGEECRVSGTSDLTARVVDGKSVQCPGCQSFGVTGQQGGIGCGASSGGGCARGRVTPAAARWWRGGTLHHLHLLRDPTHSVRGGCKTRVEALAVPGDLARKQQLGFDEQYLIGIAKGRPLLTRRGSFNANIWRQQTPRSENLWPAVGRCIDTPRRVSVARDSRIACAVIV